MSVAQIPGGARTVIHDPVIAFGIGDEARVLHRIEEPFAVVLGVGLALVHQVQEHGDDLTLAGLVRTGQRRMAIGRGVGLPWGQASVALPGDARGSRVDLVQIAQHRANRVVEAVEVEAMKCHSPGGFQGRIARA